jgi:hypothetical protein
MRPWLRRWWRRRGPPRRRWRWRSLLPRGRPPHFLRPPLRLLALRRRCWSSARPLRLHRSLTFRGRLPHQGAVTALEPPGLAPLCLAAPRGGHPLGPVVPLSRGGTCIVLVPVLRHRHLLLSFPGGGRTSGSWLPGTFAGTLLAVRCGIRNLEPAIGVASQLPDRRPPSSRVGIDARTDDRNAWSSHRALTPLGRTRDSRLNASPVIVRSAASSSALVNSELGPCTILLQSFSPVYM